MKTESSTTVFKPGDGQRLNLLARQIRDGHEAIEQFTKLAIENGCKAIGEAIIVGAASLEVKKILGHGKFGNWLKEHCKNVNERTVQRYMRLTTWAALNPTHVSETASLRKAYLLCGAIKEPKRIGNGSPSGAIPEKPHTIEIMETEPAHRVEVLEKVAEQVPVTANKIQEGAHTVVPRTKRELREMLGLKGRESYEISVSTVRDEMTKIYRRRPEEKTKLLAIAKLLENTARKFKSVAKKPMSNPVAL